MDEYVQFTSREEFRDWLEKNCMTSDGFWLLLGKKNGPVTLSANEALEEALCFGWIDGQMQRINESAYKKYFAPRRPNSNWSQKNKALVEKLEAQGRMRDCGRAKIAEAKKNGQWGKVQAPPVTEDQIAFVSDLLQGHESAHTHFLAMSLSVKKTYARAYFDAKTDAGREKRFAWMLERLQQNLKPM